ncbi:type IX secretion system membrane protein PorP/SprF [Flavobacterium sp.]|uniref:PorP/SprF family type IX secretion system membrane protein n=1 Tax=Flavobacterium sp. TaxID=239 RepID=UPI00286E824E|nr:type IX secretion system membrane protein PorP/SprF [Flavobacterium sp.]
MKKIFFTALITLLTFLDGQAQQDPHYTQYMYNMNVINPAYAGSKENLSFGLLFRKQWVDIQDSPTTFTATGHSPIGKNLGVGLSIISDRVGPVDEKNVFADISYTLNLGNDRKLAFGLKTGASFLDIGLLSEVSPTLQDQFDPAFLENVNRTNFNLGSGVFYYTNKYYIALSVPNILRSKHFNKIVRSDGIKYGSETSHYFLTGGYVFDLSPNTKFKPFAMLKSAFNAPTSIDVSTNFLFYDKLELGATYRLQDSFGALVNFKITDDLRIGYAYDRIVSEIRTSSPSSHEFILLFDLNLSKKVSSSPRYF